MSEGPPPAGLAEPAAGLPLAGGRGGAGRAPGAVRRGPRRRRRTRWRTAFFALAGVAIVGGVGWALLGDRLLVVRSVTVTGTHLVTPAQVIGAADVPLGTPLLNVDTGAVTRRVEALPNVASASVTEDWPDHVAITVTERVPVVALRMAAGGYDLVDKDGVIVRYATAKPATLPLLMTSLSGGALRGDPSVAAVTEVLTELQPWLAQQVAQVRAAPVPAGPEQVTLTLRDGTTVQWGSPGGAAQKNRELAILRGSHAATSTSAPPAPSSLISLRGDSQNRSPPALWLR